jgi:epoxyqueuosine reductase
MGLKETLHRQFANRIAAPRMAAITEMETVVASMPEAVLPIDSSPVRFDILLETLTAKDGHLSLPGFPRAVPHALSSIQNIGLSLASLEENPDQPETRMPEGFLSSLEEKARSMGVSSIGYARLPRELVFQGKAVLHDNAIVMTMEMDRQRMDRAPSPDTAVMVHETYARLGKAANRLARYLRHHGYSAHAGHPLLGLVLYPPLAKLAGLGWHGSHGLLITPGHGPRVRLAAVFTSIENLPFSQDDDHGWIQEFCAACGICIQQCPPGAILPQPVARDDGRITCIRTEACFPYFAQHDGCSICIRVCPFSQTSYHELKLRFVQSRQAMQTTAQAPRLRPATTAQHRGTVESAGS